jgi:hypothetical protein
MNKFIQLLAVFALFLIPEIGFAESSKNTSQGINLTSKFNSGGGGCIGETPVYTIDGYLKYSKKLNDKFKNRRASAALKYSSLFHTNEGMFILTIGCGYEQIQISINNESYVLSTSSNEAWNTTKVTIYKSALETQLVKEVSIKKIKTIKKVTIKPLEEDDSTFLSDVDHDLLSIEIKTNNASKTIKAVSITPFEWGGDLPKWLQRPSPAKE